MVAIGNNYTLRNKAPTRKQINEAWAKQRSKGIKQGQKLRNQLSQSIFTISVQSVQMQVISAIQQSRQSGTQNNYASANAVGARINFLI